MSEIALQRMLCALGVVLFLAGCFFWSITNEVKRWDQRGRPMRQSGPIMVRRNGRWRFERKEGFIPFRIRRVYDEHVESRQIPDI